MGRDTKITCDACGHDLMSTSYEQDYRLILGNESKRQNSGLVYGMALPAPVERTFYFCGLPCLARWLADKYPQILDDYEKLQKHRSWLAAGSPHGESKEYAAWLAVWRAELYGGLNCSETAM